MSKKFVFTSENIEEINDKLQEGYVLPRHENPYYKGEFGVRRAGVSFEFTDEELMEYTRCKFDIHYFAEKYCKIKREDGSVGAMKLRDYQKDIIDLYTKNRFSILMASRQVGKCLIFNTLCEILDNETGEIEKIPFYKLYFRLKPKKSILDYTKLMIYNLISKLEQIQK